MLKFAAAVTLIAISFAAARAATDRSPYGGWTGLTGKATGFFHVEEIDGRWWCMDPSGVAFFAIGTDHVNYNVHWCEALGYAPYARNVRTKYNDDESAWAKSAVDRLKQWNFNALGANNSPSTRGRGLSWMGFLNLGADYAGKDSIVQKVHWTGFPNVFNPAFAEHCGKKAQAQCSPVKDDPWLFGWFIDNELEWFGKSHAEAGLADEAVKRPAEHEGKQALVELLMAKYAGIAGFNAAWGTSFGSWEEARRATSWREQATEQVVADKKKFVRLCADRYFAVTTAAIRKADPNHMIIGCRFAGNAPPIWDIAGKYCDIVTLNYYGPVDLENLTPVNLVEDLTRWYKQAKRPLMVTEWSFPALDAGLPSKHGAGMRVATQADKAKCFEVYQKTFFSLPFVVGSDYFMWVDEPALGISKTFPEDSNYGLVDVNDDAWEVFTKTVARVNAKAYDIHSGKTAELKIAGLTVADPATGGGKPGVRGRATRRELKLKVKNEGSISANPSVAIRIDDRSYERSVSVPAGGMKTATIQVALKPGAHYVELEIDPQGTLDEVNRGDNKASQFVYIAGKAPANAKAAIGVFGTSGGRSCASVLMPRIPGFPQEGLSPEDIRLLDEQGREVKVEVFDLDNSGTVTRGDELMFEVGLEPGVPQTYYLEVISTVSFGPCYSAKSLPVLRSRATAEGGRSTSRYIRLRQGCGGHSGQSEPHNPSFLSSPQGVSKDDSALLKQILAFGRGSGSSASVDFVRPLKMDSIAIDTGVLKCSKNTRNGTAIESIQLGDLEMGSFEILIQQSGGGTWWTRPDKLEGLRLWEGSLCKRLEVTASRTVPADAGSGPFAYRATYGFDFYPGRQWFTSQFLSLTNTDSRPWTFDSYFYYLQSAIGGKIEDDDVGLVGAAGTAAWADDNVGAWYGIVAPPSTGVQVVFWKDAANFEHSDARRKVGKFLRSGETYAQPGEPVYLFCASTKEDPQAWQTLKQQIAGLPRWQVFKTVR